MPEQVPEKKSKCGPGFRRLICHNSAGKIAFCVIEPVLETWRRGGAFAVKKSGKDAQQHMLIREVSKSSGKEKNQNWTA